MAFVRTHKEPEIGDRVKTTKIHKLEYGYFEVGTEVTVVGISERGYDIVDDEGNKMTEIGWTI